MLVSDKANHLIKQKKAVEYCLKKSLNLKSKSTILRINDQVS